LLSVPSLSLDWPSVGADAWARWFSLLSRWAGAALHASTGLQLSLCAWALWPPTAPVGVPEKNAYRSGGAVSNQATSHAVLQRSLLWTA